MAHSLGKPSSSVVIPSRRETARNLPEDVQLHQQVPSNESVCEAVSRIMPLPNDKTAPVRRGETAAHRKLKQLAFLWAQENGYRLAALEVSLPKCRYRADVAAYCPQRNGTIGHTAVFECKQSALDLRRDDCRSPQTIARLESVYRRQQILQKHLRVHYPTLRTGETLFPDWDDWNFAGIEHRGYRRVIRELTALQNQLRDGRKFERLSRYGCANLLYLVLPRELLRVSEAPLGWGLLVAEDGALRLERKPVWKESSEAARLRIVEKIAAAATRYFNRQYDLAPQTPWSPRDR